MANEYALDGSFEPLHRDWKLWLAAYVLGFGALAVALVRWGSP